MQRSCSWTFNRPYHLPLASRAVVMLFAAITYCWTVPAAAQTTPADPDAVDIQTLRERIAELEQAADPESTDILTGAGAFIDQVDALAARTRQFEEDARVAPQIIEQIDAFLAVPIDEQISGIDPDWDQEALSLQRQTTQALLESEQQLLAKIETDTTHRRTRREEIPRERAAATARLEEIRGELAAAPDPEVAPQVAQARRVRLQAERAVHMATLSKLDAELRSYDIRKPVLEKRRADRERRIAIAERELLALADAAARLEQREAEEARREAARLRTEAANSHEAVQAILERNFELSVIREELIGERRKGLLRRAAVDDVIATWSAAFKRSQERVDRVGLSNAIGHHLRNQRMRLPDPRGYRQEMRDREKRIDTLVNDSEVWSEQLEQLDDLDASVEQALDEVDEPRPEDPEALATLEATVRSGLEQQASDLRDLVDIANDSLDTTLLELQTVEGDLCTLLATYEDFIDERILWTRSAEPVGRKDLPRLAEAVQQLFGPTTWKNTAARLADDVRHNPFLWGLASLLLLAGLTVIRLRTRAGLATLAEKTRRASTDRLGHTLLAILLTIAMAAVWPLLLAFIGHRLSITGRGDELTTAVAAGISRVAALLFVFELLRLFCRPGGVADAHFRWRNAALTRTRRSLRWLAPVALPLAFIVAAARFDGDATNSLGRAAFIAGMLALSVFIFQVCSPTNGIFREWVMRSKGGWIDRLKYIWYPALVAIPFALAITAAAGYLYTAVRLEQRSLNTVWLILAAILIHAVLLRGLALAQRRLAIEQAKKRLAEKTKAAAEARAQAVAQGLDPQPEVVNAPPPEVDIDVAAVSTQSRRLLQSALTFAIAIGVVLIWIDVLPAFERFREVELWPLTTAATATEAAATPTLIPTGEATADETPEVAARSTAAPTSAPEPKTAITLADLILAIVIATIAFAFSKNLPGLLEITVLQRLPITPSGRYAFTTIARYILVIIGIVLAFNAIGIGWAKVQWLAAAATVGLGFGLQEIFANFVSGLIILFERPIRVGDTVTVGGINGTVTKIRMRATTILDWDRKELIVPNREFVTGQIVNWTLSDPVLRIIIPVGIAYGSDTKLAEQLLLKVVRESPMVLNDPPSDVVFAEFGDSALIFRLRLFIPHIDSLWTVRHRIHNEIDQEFRKAGISIAFPQMDVHLHQTAPPKEPS